MRDRPTVDIAAEMIVAAPITCRFKPRVAAGEASLQLDPAEIRERIARCRLCTYISYYDIYVQYESERARVPATG
jgi:hypothetical protein